MQSETDHLEELADALEELAAIDACALEYDQIDMVDEEWVDPRGSEYWTVWNDVCRVAQAHFAPLNYIRDPESGMRGMDPDDTRHRLELITVAPQEDPEVKLHVTYWATGELEANAVFVNPTDGSWESLYRGEMRAYDDETATDIRNRLVYIEEGWIRSEELKEGTVLSARESQVQALKERDYTHQEIADILGIQKGTVDALSSRISDRIEQARTTVELLDAV